MTTIGGKIGRPKKAPGESRTERLSGIRLTPAERNHLAAMVAAAGVDEAEFCRRAILGQRIVARRSDVNERALVELNKIGVNLNQIAHAANSGRGLPDMTAAALDELRTVLAKVLAHGS